MDKDTVYKFQKRWTTLKKQSLDLDYQFALFSKDFRAQFPKGDTGDNKFIKYAMELLTGVDEKQAKTMLVQALSTTVLTDEKAYRVVGGSRQLDKLVLHDKKEQLAIIEIAIKDTRTIGSAIIQREIATGKRPPLPPPINHKSNAEFLAKLVRRTLTKIPKDAELVLSNYPES